MKYIRMVAQVLLAVIATAFLSVIFAIISPQTGKSFLNNLITSIPILELWVDLLSNYHSFDLANVTNIYLSTFFQSTIMGICMAVCKKTTDFLHITRALPFGNILVTFVGILVGSVLCSSMDSQETISIVAIGLIIIYGLLLMIRSFLPPLNILSLKDILIILINSIVAVILIGYVAALYLCAEGSISVSLLIKTAIITIISLLILYTVDGDKA